MGKLIKLTANKDFLSFNDVYEEYYKRILSYFIKQIGNVQEAEDLTSEVFLYCYKNFDTYDQSKASISTWLYLIAKSRFYNYCRDKKQTENIDDYANIIEDKESLVESATYIEELRKRLSIALSNLTDRQRKIVVMKYFEGKNAVEIADQMNTSANNIRVQLSKALKRLQSFMEDWE